jgi:cytosine/adenosine deaminase-related metal-dependent hydrolase
LKLGSGIARLENIFSENINVTLGTDGAASNNTLDVMKEAYLAAILQKGSTGRTDSVSSGEFIKMLNDDILRSDLTGWEYDSPSKKVLEPLDAGIGVH